MKKIVFGCILLLASNQNVSADNARNLKISCDKGNIEKCFKLAHMYRDGSSVNRDYTKAIKYYNIACNGGYPEACNNLGVRYLNGQGTIKDEKQAKKFFTQACNNNIHDGCHNLIGLTQN